MCIGAKSPAGKDGVSCNSAEWLSTFCNLSPNGTIEKRFRTLPSHPAIKKGRVVENALPRRHLNAEVDQSSKNGFS